MDNDLIQDTNLDLLQVNAVEVEYSGIAPINVDNQEHTISLDPSALSSKLDTSAFDEWTATHSAGEEYSAGEGIDITDHVISYTGDPGDATPWISGNKIITSADTMQPGEYVQVLSSFDLSGNKNHFITVKGQGYYFPTNQDLKERVGVEDYLPLSSFSSYTASIADNLQNNWNYTNSAYSQSLNNYYNKLDISAFSSWSSEHSGDYLTKESADTLYQPIGDYLTTADSGNFYPMEGNPSGFLTGVDLSNYYEKNETSSKEEIENAITSVENIINNLSGEYYPLTSNPSGYLTAHQSLDDYQKTADMTAYQEAGDYYSASNPSGFITGVDLSDYYKKNETSSKEEISDALTSKLDTTAFDPNAFYPSSNPSGFITGVDLTDYVERDELTAYQEKGDYYSASNPSGFITGVDLSNYYEKNETSSKEEISAAFEALSGIDDPYELSAGDGISIVNDNTAKKTIINSTGISSKLDTTAFTAYTATAVQGFEYTGIAPIDVNNTTHQISADVWTLSARNGISILEDAENKVTTIDFIGGSGFYPMTGNPSGFLTATDTSSKQQISAALNGKQDNLTFAGSNSIISSINGSALSAGDKYNFDRNVFVDDGHVYVKNYDDSTFVMTSNLDDTYYNASLHNANITSSSRIKILLNEPVNRLVFRPCNASYAPTNYGSTMQSYYTAFGTAHGNDGMLLTSDVPKTEWYIDIDRINQNTGFYYMQIFPDYNPWAGSYNLSAYLANTGWVDETLATQPWVLSQLTGQGGGSNIHWYIDTPVEHTSADIDLTIQTTASLGGGYDRNLLDGNGNFIGALIPSAASEDLGKVLTITAGSPRWQDLPETPSGAYGIKTEVVANSGMATGQNILYIVTGN